MSLKQKIDIDETPSSRGDLTRENLVKTAMKIFARDGFDAVSYTHLDVYKRQEIANINGAKPAVEFSNLTKTFGPIVALDNVKGCLLYTSRCV